MDVKNVDFRPPDPRCVVGAGALSWTFPEGRTGRTCLYQGKSLHSGYDPVSEARKWAHALSIESGSLVFLAGDVLGYAAAAIEATHPRCVVRRLLPDPRCPRTDRDWDICGVSLTDYLWDEFENGGPQSVRFEVWPAFERLCPELVKTWVETFRSVYRQVQGSWLTYRRFGRSFWKNAVRNLVEWQHPARIVPGDRPIVVAASGPSLERAFRFLESERSRFDLWALPSSFAALVERGTIPDLAITTDGGYYAREHLRALAKTNVPIACAASGAVDPSIDRLPRVVFSQSYEVERRLLPLFVPSAIEIPAQGTVAVTAIKLALASTTGAVYVCGMDLCYDDLRAHARPHSTNRLLEPTFERKFPGESVHFERALRYAPELVAPRRRTSSAMLTYAAWLDSPERFGRRVYRIDPSPVVWSSTIDATWEDVVGRHERGTRALRIEAANNDWPTRDRRAERIRTALVDLSNELARPGCEARLLESVARTLASDELLSYVAARRFGEPEDRSSLVRSCRRAIDELVEGIAR